MATIPLPALHVQAPEQPDMLGQMAKVMQIKGLQQQGQLGNIQLQQAQLALQDQQKMRQAFMQSGGDFEKTFDLASQAGVSPQTLIGLKNSILEQKQKAATLTKTQRESANLQATAVENDVKDVLSLPPEQRPAAVQQKLATHVQQGMMSPDEANQFFQQYQQQGDDFLKFHGMAASAAKKQLAEVEEAQSKAKESAASAQMKGNEAAYQSTLQKLANNQPVTPEEYKNAKAFEASNAKTTTTSDSLGVTSTNTNRPGGLAAVGRGGAPAAGGAASGGGGNSPQSLSGAIVDQIGQYKLNPAQMSRMMVKHPEIIAQVQQKYPDWNQPQYNVINKAVTDLAPNGSTGKQVISYNQFLRHSANLFDAIDTLGNSSYSDLMNKPLNWIASHTGDPRVAAFNAALQPPMKEFQSFLLGGHAMHDEDVKDAHTLIDMNKTPQEMKAVLKQFAETGSARLSELNNQFKSVTGRDIPNLVSKEGAAAYNKIIGATVKMKAPDGTTRDIPKDQVDHYKSLGATVIGGQ